MKQLLVLALTCVLAACGSQKFEQGPPPMPKEFGIGNDYKIGVGDQISIQVWRNEELSAQVPVRPDGKVSSPLVGDIVAAGLTSQELATTITEKLKTYLRNPEVTVIVDNPASSDFLRRVRVTGAVRNPLSVSHRQGMTVIDLVLQAGGITEFASANNAKLYRKVEEETKIYRIKLGDILEKGDLSTNYPLAPSDVLTVPERSF